MNSENNLKKSSLILTSLYYFCIKNNLHLIYSKNSALIGISNNNKYYNSDFFKQYEPLTQFNNIDIITNEYEFNFKSNAYLKSITLELNLIEKQKLFLHLLEDSSLINKVNSEILFKNSSIEFCFPSISLNVDDEIDFKFLKNLNNDLLLSKICSSSDFDGLYNILKNKKENYILQFFDFLNFNQVHEKLQENIIFNILKFPISLSGITTLSKKFPDLLNYYHNNNSNYFIDNIVKFHFNFNDIFKNHQLDYYLIDNTFKLFKSPEIYKCFNHFNINIEKIAIQDHYADFFVANNSQIPNQVINSIILNVFNIVNNYTMMSIEFRNHFEKYIFNELLNYSISDNNIIKKTSKI